MRLDSRAAWPLAVVLGTIVAPVPAADDAIAQPIAALKAVEREGKNNDAVGLAWKALVSAGAPALFPALEVIDDANPTASNWLRTAVGAIAEGEVKAKRPLPAEKLEAFAKDVKFAPSARVLAYELLASQDKTAPARLLIGFLNDPSADLRRAAVAAEFEKLEKSAKPSVKADLEKLLSSARDKDQVEAIAAKLEKDYKTKISLTEHFGFITHWNLIGPFESVQGKALTLKHRPEEMVVLDEKLKGKDGEVKWKSMFSRDKFAIVDFNKEIGALHGAAAYATAVLHTGKATPVEIRVGSPNAVQVFLNGKKLFEREEYHHGDNMDYHIAKGQLAIGANVLVVKICQNDQKEVWAQRWQFQARVCDATGAPLPGVTQTLRGDDFLQNIKLGSIPPADSKEDKK